MTQRKGPGFDDPDTRGSASDARRKAFVERRQASIRTVFISRALPPSKGFRWEIRRFGTFVLKGSEVDYDTAAAARTAGEEALEGWTD